MVFCRFLLIKFYSFVLFCRSAVVYATENCSNADGLAIGLKVMSLWENEAKVFLCPDFSRKS